MLQLISVSLVALYLLVGIIWFAGRRSGYSHIRHTISELGETGAPDSRLVSLGLFAPVGAGLLALAAMTLLGSGEREQGESFGLLAAAVGIGYLGAAIVPCDPGSPISGSPGQDLHNLVGGIEYLGGALVLFAASQSGDGTPWHSWWLMASAAVVGIVAISLTVQAGSPGRGLVQRVGEVVLFGNLIILAAGR